MRAFVSGAPGRGAQLQGSEHCAVLSVYWGGLASSGHHTALKHCVLMAVALARSLKLRESVPSCERTPRLGQCLRAGCLDRTPRARLNFGRAEKEG